MSQLTRLRELIPNASETDSVLQFYLDCAKDIICEIRNSNEVESKYLNVQLQIAMELYSKVGAEGETSHSENGIARAYESADISPSLIKKITPIIKTPFSKVRIVNI